METRTSGDLLARYKQAKSEKANVEGMISKMESELQTLYKGVFHNIRRARTCLERLDALALKPNPLTEVEYIDLLIESEKQQKKPGWNTRVEYFSQVREQAVLLANMTDQSVVDEMTEECNKSLWQQFSAWVSKKIN